jgi:hypothetical protein
MRILMPFILIVIAFIAPLAISPNIVMFLPHKAG